MQQYESLAQISPAHVSHVFVSLMPVEHSECAHVEPPPPPPPPPEHDSPHTDATSPTQIESHDVAQQYESAAHT